MRCLIIADDEFVIRRVAAEHADVLVSLGDMPDDIIFQVAERCQCREILAVKGNHDSAAPFPSPIRDLHHTTLQLDGLTFGGFCGSWKYKPRGHHMFDQDEVQQLLADFPPVDVFLAHNSPRLVHDRDDEVHLGFVAFSNYIARARPRFFLHGHQHHNEETLLGPTRVVGTFGHRYLELASIDAGILNFVQTSLWRFARTMPEHPHEYVVRAWRPDQEAIFERFVLTIREQGYDERFLQTTYRYLEIDGWKYWTMGAPLNETIIINRAKVGTGSPGVAKPSLDTI